MTKNPKTATSLDTKFLAANEKESCFLPTPFRLFSRLPESTVALRPFGGGGVSFSPLLLAGLRAGLVLRDTEPRRTTENEAATPCKRMKCGPVASSCVIVYILVEWGHEVYR